MEFIDIKAQYQALKQEIDAGVAAVLSQGHFIMGAQVDAFEDAFGAYLGGREVVSCGNGTDALYLAYLACGIGQGDAVFVPDMTFIASVEPACALGATPVFCDIDPETLNVSPDALESRIKQVLKSGKLNPKAIVAVDFLGNPCDYDRLQAIADHYGLLLIEDAAQSVGASCQKKKCGAFGDIATTSFFPTKPLGCYGDGGAVMTDDPKIAELLRSLRSHGKGADKYDNIRIGVNSRLDTLQAAVLNVKLAHLDAEIEMRSHIAARYQAAFHDCYRLQRILPETVSAFAQYALIADSRAERDAAMDALKTSGIPSIVYYPKCLHQQAVFRNHPFSEDAYPHSENYAACSFALPFSPYLQEPAQARIIERLAGARQDACPQHPR